MPLYLCQASKGSLDDEQKSAIAGHITDIHCSETGAPRLFVHVFFLDIDVSADSQAPAVQVSGNIRAGRTLETKTNIRSRIAAAIEETTGAVTDAGAVSISDTPASWVMEGGAVFPEPGEEAAWLEKHGAKLGHKIGVEA